MVRRGSVIGAGAVVALLVGQAIATFAGLDVAPALAGVPASQVSTGQPAETAAEPPPAIASSAAVPAWWSASPPRLASYASLVIAALLLLLYVYRRYLYILQWVFSWLLRAAGTFVASLSVSGGLALALLGLTHLLNVAAALLLVMSADTYRGGASINRKWAWGLLPVVIWFILAPLGFGRQAVDVPGYLISASILATAAVVYVVDVRRVHSLGAVLVGAMLALLAASHTWIAFSSATGGQGSFALQSVNALLLLFAALGMHLMVFEEMTVELRLTNRRLEKARAGLHEMVITDPLTTCYNRRFFDEVIGRELQRRERYHTPLSLLFLDVDRFKAVNDTFGHETGDLVLQYVATFLKQNVREVDYLFRWGGDEFLVLMSCHLEQAIQKGVDLKAAFAAASETAKLPPGVGLSFGCTEVPDGTDDVMPLIREADQRMYEDKMGSARSARQAAQ